LVKIVRVDNYDRETRSERLVAENIRNDREAKIMLQALREDPEREDQDWFSVKPDEYVLYVFDPT